MGAFWSHPRPIGSTRILCELGQDKGLSLADCLRDSGITARDLNKKRALVQGEQELQVARNLLDALGYDQPLGLEAGQLYHPTTFAAWGFAILSSLTARQAVEIAVRYLALSSAFCSMRIEDVGDESYLISDASELPADLRRFVIERDAAIALTLQRDVLPMRIPLTGVEFQFEEPEDVEPYTAFFGIRPRFGQPLNRASVKAVLGDMKLPQGDASALSYCEEECQRLLDAHAQRSGMAGQVRDLLMAQTRDMPTMQATAEQLNLSARSLRRRLAEEDTDYETLVAEIRRSLAEELLREDVLNVEQIAERLGYAEVASFSRAFKRWTGTSPRQYRQSQ